MWQFAESTKGVADACKGIHLKHNPDYSVPIIAGNVSFYNESSGGAIPPSPIVSCLGRLSDVDKAITMGFKKKESVIILIGERKNELGGSVYYSIYNFLGKNLPKPDLKTVEAEIWALTDLIDNQLILSAHDISDGGVAVALSEMSFQNEIGFEVNIGKSLRADVWLFSETGGFVIEVDKENLQAVATTLSSHEIYYKEIGETTDHQAMLFGKEIHMPIFKAKDNWGKSLREKIK
jgi:phosphoribosylformylglycinamidine synthase